MKKVTLIIILVLIGMNVLTFTLMRDNQDEDPHTPPSLSKETDSNELVAKVNGTEIYQQDWLAYLEENYGEESLKEMIDREVVKQLADQHDLTIDPAVIDLEVAFLSTLAGRISEDQVESLEQEWRETIEHRLLTEMLFTKDVDVSEEEIQTYYKTYQSQYQFSERVELSHIVVDDQSIADQVIQELENGATFQSLAYEYTIDDDTRSSGGYLGFFTTESTTIPYGYLDQANDLAQFSYSEPFLGPDGYTILYLHRELPAINLDYEQLKDYIEVKIAIEKLGEIPNVESLWEQLEVDWVY